MVFSSFIFLVLFLPLVLALYFGVPKRARNYILLVVSLIFYGWGEPVYVLLMIGSVLVAWICGLLLERALAAGREAGAKGIVAFAILCFMGTLSVFKVGYAFWDWALPIGISFYSFQILSYVIDVYRGDTKVQKNPFYLGTYVALFPQLIAGPIVRYQTVAQEIHHRSESVKKFGDGAGRFVAGLGKKVVLANGAGYVFAQIQLLPLGEISALTAWISALAYAFQIYFDFSGYSDMAIGLGKMFGFEFLENFDYPYISKSITEFWRRWHISLSTWFRDYVYIPLGGNRRSKARHIFNLFVVWILTGLWHGFGWNFPAWGLYYFVLLMMEKYFLKNFLEKVPGFLAHLYALFFINLGWLLFSIEDGGRFFGLFKAMFGFGQNGPWDRVGVFYLLNYGGLMLLAAVASTPLLKKLGEGLEGRAPVLAGALAALGTWCLFLLSMACLAGESFNPFLYFRF